MNFRKTWIWILMKTNADLKHSNKDMKIFLPIVVAFCAAVKTFKWKCKQSVAKLFMLHTVYTVGIKLVVDRPDCFYLSFLMMLLHTVVSSLLVNTCWTSTHSASSDPCIHYNADPDPRPYWAVTKLILKKITILVCFPSWIRISILHADPNRGGLP